METIMQLKKGWKVLQDVHDTGEKLKIYEKKDSFTDVGSQISEWEDLEELKHLQLLYAKQPYFGRELRYFNQAPWWYQIEFEIPNENLKRAVLRFTNVDYYAKVWLNGIYLGDHEGYSVPFSFDVEKYLKPGEKNYLAVKVSSPWDEEVELDEENSRTILVKRNMVKGTYEHSDTFIQRDVNPVGIYGNVELLLTKEGMIRERPEIVYELEEGRTRARLNIKTWMDGMEQGENYEIHIEIKEKESGRRKICKEERFIAEKQSLQKVCTFCMEDIQLWNIWDHGYPWMYEIQTKLKKNGNIISTKNSFVAFRDVEIERTEDATRFWMNGHKIYIRGTSYYPDCYISAMTKERYFRDLLNIKAAGFNLVRVHVHTEQESFYDLCDQLGIAVLQDSEYNWTHPSTDQWAERFVNCYRENVKLLKQHPSLICWIIMNEPGCVDPDGKTRERFMEENPGPRLYKEVQEMDPGRPIIKGSFCENDLFSGDSHNYLGSLSGGQYEEIYEQKEKLNTEYGFDAPACQESLKKIPKLYKRLSGLADQIPEIQEYQYKLLKYYTEHYRIQKYAPCAGYVQFMFIDLCPQSFYGLYDWWGIPKKGLEAILESNKPVGVFAEHKDFVNAIYVVNDTEQVLENLMVSWIFTETQSGNFVSEGSCKLKVGADARVKVTDFDHKYGKGKKWNLFLKVVDANGVCVAKNSYTDICTLWKRVKGHPERMSHEMGMRLYWA